MNPITNFFKPPSKPDAKKPDKPKDLFGYFKKSTTEDGPKMSGSATANGSVGGMAGASGDKKEINKSVDLNDSIQDFDVNPEPGQKTDNKVESKADVNPKSQKKTDNKEKVKKQPTKKTKKKSLEINKSDKKVKEAAVKTGGSNSEEVEYGDSVKESKTVSCKDFLSDSIDVDVNMGKHNGEDCERICQNDDTPETEDRSKTGEVISSKNKDDIAKDDRHSHEKQKKLEGSEVIHIDDGIEPINIDSKKMDNNMEKFHQADNIMEISYEDFLFSQTDDNDSDSVTEKEEKKVCVKDKVTCKSRSQEKSDVKVKKLKKKNEVEENNKDSQKTNCKSSREEQKKDKDGEPQTKIVKPKPVGGIANFFTKIDTKKREKKKDGEVVTVTAVVHTGLVASQSVDSASPSPKQTRKDGRRGKSNVVVDCTADDLTITQLDSTIITLPEKKSGKRKRDSEEEKSVILIRSDEEEEEQPMEKNSCELEQEKPLTVEDEQKNEVIKGEEEEETNNELEQKKSLIAEVEQKKEIIKKKDEDEKKNKERKQQAAVNIALLDKVPTGKKTTGKKTTQSTLNFGGKIDVEAEKCVIEVNSDEEQEQNKCEPAKQGKTSLTKEEEKKKTEEEAKKRKEEEEIKKEERKQQAAIKMASLDFVQVPTAKKTSQCTLNFGGKGSMLIKPPTPNAPKAASKVDNKKTLSKSRVRKNQEEDVFTTSKKKRKKKNVIESDNEDTPEKVKEKKRGKQSKGSLKNKSSTKKTQKQGKETVKKGKTKNMSTESENEVQKPQKKRDSRKKLAYTSHMVKPKKKGWELKIKITR